MLTGHAVPGAQQALSRPQLQRECGRTCPLRVQPWEYGKMRAQ